MKNIKPNYRTRAINGIAIAADRADFESCRVSAFKTLYGLSSVLQFELMTFVLNRYEPIYSSHVKDTEWLISLRRNPHEWFELNGRKFPMPKKTGPADSAFIFSIDALLWACENGNDKTILASSAVCCIGGTIDAMMTNVWQADAPLAVKTWEAISVGAHVSGEDYENLYGNTLLENKAALAVGKREWTTIVDFLLDRNVSGLRDETTKAEIEKGMLLWQESEMLLLS